MNIQAAEKLKVGDKIRIHNMGSRVHIVDIYHSFSEHPQKLRPARYPMFRVKSDKGAEVIVSHTYLEILEP